MPSISFATRTALLIGLASFFPLLGQGASTKEQAANAISEFQSYAKNTNAHVRKAATDDLGRVDHVLVTRKLLECLKDPSEMVVASAIFGLGNQRNKLGVSELIQRLWRGRKRTERVAIIKSFQTSVPKTALSAVLDLVDDKDWEIRAQAAELISRYPDPEGVGLGSIKPLFTDREVLVRLAAMDALTRLENPRGHSDALVALADKDWRVQASAIRVCRRWRRKSSVQPLIKLLRAEEGRLQDDATDALQDICDRDIPGDADRWQKWWDRVKDGFKVPTAEQVAERKRKENTRRSGYDKPRPNEYPPYHGIKTRSRRLLFVIDISSSMVENVVLDQNNRASIERFRERYGDMDIKIDVAREELIKMVAGLKPFAKFNIITFDAKIKKWKKNLVPATSGNKGKAIKFLARLKPETLLPTGGGFGKAAAMTGQTNSFEALNAAFGLFKGDEFDKKKFKTEADTVFFLSDGNPTTGRITQPQTLLEYFRTVNKRAKIVLHSISFGNSNRVLMEGLATYSGGQYVMIGN